MPEDAIVFSSNPWELAFHTRRRTVVLPFSKDLQLLRSIANRYGVEYIAIVRKDARHRGYDNLENGIFGPWVERVYYSDTLVIGRLRP